MFGDFFSRALIAGIGLAAVTGPLGCFVIWRRMSYFGDTMAHSALLGVALAMLLSVNVTLGVFVVAAMVAGALLVLQRQNTLSVDALLGILSHATLAVGLVLVGFLTTVRIDLMGFLFGDILAVSLDDIIIIYAGGAAILLMLILNWRPLLASTVSPELAEAEGLRPEVSRVILMLLMACVIAISMKLVGVLLITSLLIIPAATARRLSATPEMMALVASGLGMIAVVGGLFGSRTWDTASGPSIVVMALVLFLLSLLVPAGRLFGRKEHNGA
ncbi:MULTISPECIES: metal ABC transporter permease [unclassified Devosia]|uniref:metal ABC transporter permease n=1 Tax=unclassified Devosia TaxID=196773 RepID=UPI00145D29BC|nr:MULTISPECIES: metal ABC transporter permease [unclassified Devosia]MBJ6988319.1 metal ABC transporter permease [Devosia sp. MC521]QMW63177.1 metal ABC transporter permease [Devosia sp. MC521]